VEFKENFIIIDPVIKHNTLYDEKMSSIGSYLPHFAVQVGRTNPDNEAEQMAFPGNPRAGREHPHMRLP